MQEDSKLKISLGYIVSSRLAQQCSDRNSESGLETSSAVKSLPRVHTALSSIPTLGLELHPFYWGGGLFKTGLLCVTAYLHIFITHNLFTLFCAQGELRGQGAGVSSLLSSHGFIRLGNKCLCLLLSNELAKKVTPLTTVLALPDSSYRDSNKPTQTYLFHFALSILSIQ